MCDRLQQARRGAPGGRSSQRHSGGVVSCDGESATQRLRVSAPWAANPKARRARPRLLHVQNMAAAEAFGFRGKLQRSLETALEHLGDAVVAEALEGLPPSMLQPPCAHGAAARETSHRQPCDEQQQQRQRAERAGEGGSESQLDQVVQGSGREGVRQQSNRQHTYKYLLDLLGSEVSGRAKGTRACGGDWQRAAQASALAPSRPHALSSCVAAAAGCAPHGHAAMLRVSATPILARRGPCPPRWRRWRRRGSGRRRSACRRRCWRPWASRRTHRCDMRRAARAHTPAFARPHGVCLHACMPAFACSSSRRMPACLRLPARPHGVCLPACLHACVCLLVLMAYACLHARMLAFACSSSRRMPACMPACLRLPARPHGVCRHAWCCSPSLFLAAGLPRGPGLRARGRRDAGAAICGRPGAQLARCTRRTTDAGTRAPRVRRGRIESGEARWLRMGCAGGRDQHGTGRAGGQQARERPGEPLEEHAAKGGACVGLPAGHGLTNGPLAKAPPRMCAWMREALLSPCLPPIDAWSCRVKAPRWLVCVHAERAVPMLRPCCARTGDGRAAGEEPTQAQQHGRQHPG